MGNILSSNPSMDGNQEHQPPPAPPSSTTSSNGGPTPNSQTKKSPNHQSPSSNSSIDDNQEHQPPSFPSSSTTSGNTGPPPNSQTMKAPNPINAMLDDHKPGESDINTSKDSKASQRNTSKIQQALNQGRGTRALSHVNKLIVVQPWCSELHRLKAQVYAAIAKKTSDSRVKKLNLELAIACAKDAVVLASNQYSSLCYLASLLLEVADDAQGYQLALEQCQRALEINEKDEGERTEAKNLLKCCQDEKIKFLWTQLPRHARSSLLRVAKFVLQAHFESVEKLAADIIAEAVAYGQSHGTWRFFLCSLCGEKLPTSDILFEHWTNVHIARLPLQVQILLCSGTWRPIHRFPSADLYSSTSTNMPSNDKTHSITLDEQLKERVGIEDQYLYLYLFLGVPTVEAGEVVSPTLVTSISDKLWEVDPINSIKHILAVGPITEHLDSWNSLTNKILSEGSQLQQTLKALTTDVQLQDIKGLPMTMKEALENLSMQIASEILENGVCIMPTAEECKTLVLTKNPFGALDYGQILSPLLRSYIKACLELYVGVDPVPVLQEKTGETIIKKGKSFLSGWWL